MTQLLDEPFVAYTYGYPHKTAYRPLAPPLPLCELWARERRDALFLYLHLPFCEHRCGFCNLFTQSQPAAEMPSRYLAQLHIEAERVRAALGEAQFARLAVGGGTPTFLHLEQLQSLFDLVEQVMGVATGEVDVSCEASPATITPEKLALLRERGVDRLSLGVQTFDQADLQSLGRPGRQAQVTRALAAARDAEFPTLNIDLIYGGQGQTLDSWLASLREALSWHPEELYLYPLYIRPLTGLGRADGRMTADNRLLFYRAGRQLLLDAGYQQVSLRMFRAPHAPSESGPVYCCQSDGMVGLGCGARSYTTRVHYSTEYAVGRQGIGVILNDYLRRPPAAFDAAHYGIRLDEQDQRRRFVLLSLLQAAELSRTAYASRFGADLLGDLPQLAELQTLDLAVVRPDRVELTEAGLERSDAIGPWLYSQHVRRRMEEYQWR